MSLVLAQLALQSGLPIIEKLLSKKLGDKGGQLAAEVLRAIAGRAGVSPEGVEVLADTDTPRVLDAMREVEKQSPELIALYAAGVQGQFDLLQAEQGEPVWMRAWRPVGMYLILFFWLWNIVVLHVCNAVFKIALPPAPFDALGWLTGVYFGLYMGGHTIKDVIGKWVTK
jgi:hypothetical protein